MKSKIKHLFGGLKGVFVVLFTFLVFPFARLFLWHKKIWIVSEFGYEARDNGYCFFKYMRTNHRDINCYYAIDFNSVDYPKVNTLGNVIKFGSFKHLVYWCSARCIISSKTQGFCPNYYLTLLRKKIHLWGKYVFLQHGITKDDQKFLYKKKSKIDLFICGAKPEYDDVLMRYGYSSSEVVYTGFSRFDSYYNVELKNQIFVMPTWRRYAENVPFNETNYFKTWLSFINSKKINNLLKEENTMLYFYLHPHFMNYSSYFKTSCLNIKVCSFEECDIQKMIKESKMLITDFSSLAFDFGYMNKPVIYYQYDEQEYFRAHYIKGYFDYRKDGFGPVCNTYDTFVNVLKMFIKNDFLVSQKYLVNQSRFFPVHDSNNSYRIYKAISNMIK